MKNIILVFFISTVILNAQQNENTFLLNLKTGLTFSGLSVYRFPLVSSSNFYSIYPSYLLGIGMEKESVINFYNAHLGFCLEINSGKSTTGFVSIGKEEIKFETTSLPILIWVIFKSEGQIVPFLKVGVGAENSSFSETLKNNTENNFKLEDWFFVWGIGAGIDFNIYENIRLSIFVDTVIKETWFNTKLNNGRTINYDSRYGVIFGGFQFGYKL